MEHQTASPVEAFRIATVSEAGAIEALMKVSTARLFPHFYDRRQTESAVRYVAVVDRMLIIDGTYFVADVGGGLIACGGWSRRDRLYTGAGGGAGDQRLLDPAREPARVRAMFVHPDWTRRGLGTRLLERCEEAARSEGFARLSLVATLPGVPLYQRFGFAAGEAVEVRLPDGVLLGAVAMEKPITAAA